MVTKHDRIFVHTNLLLSLGLGNLVYVLDDRLFMNRKEHPVSGNDTMVLKREGWEDRGWGLAGIVMRSARTYLLLSSHYLNQIYKR